MSVRLSTCPICGGDPTQEDYNEFNDQLQFQDCGSKVYCETCGFSIVAPTAGVLCGMEDYSELEAKWDPGEAHEWVKNAWNTPAIIRKMP
jgi:hypothetical protein